jgi:hypothetical protein
MKAMESEAKLNFATAPWGNIHVDTLTSLHLVLHELPVCFHAACRGSINEVLFNL